jgi:hypothetical protein
MRPEDLLVRLGGEAKLRELSAARAAHQYRSVLRQRFADRTAAAAGQPRTEALDAMPPSALRSSRMADRAERPKHAGLVFDSHWLARRGTLT